MSLKISIKNEVLTIPFTIDDKYEGNVLFKENGEPYVKWDYQLFTNIQDEYDNFQIKDIEEKVLNLIKLIKK